MFKIVIETRPDKFYKCPICGEMVKDKFIFGTLHFCLTEEEQKQKLDNRKSK